ncbi:MAG: hypothetical protein AB7G93_03025 [Bdellovibrionales bacterium]
MNNAEEFLRQKELFQLGELPTETPHPKTLTLSRWAQEDLDQALRVLHEVDLEALQKTAARETELESFFATVAETLRRGHRIFLVGCGATGRLSLSLEYLWRRRHPKSQQVLSLMAGGDVALVHSLEGFEDFPAYGARHLRQMGFGPDDLLIGSTEGGETPYVIGAVEEATRISSRPPLFLYCNTTRLLIEKIERSRRVLTHPGIQSYCLETGPMALTGSTRMQASTVLMLVVGLALEFPDDIEGAFQELESWIRFLRNSDPCALKPFILRESETYQENDCTIYSTNDLAITTFTDTTERAPTFNLPPFDNPTMLTDRHSYTYVSIPAASTSDQAWFHLLAREPRPLEWPEVHGKTSKSYLLSFDFSRKAHLFRQSLLPQAQHHAFTISTTDGDKDLTFQFRGIEEHFPLPQSTELFTQLTAKLLLNMHSTLVMGRLGRFEGNLMTWVTPSNGKLVDRAARYTQILLQRRGHGDFDYDEIVRAQFAAKAQLSPQESIVHKTMDLLLGVG